MTDLVNLRIPAEFVLDRAIPTAGEIAFGFEQGWVGRKDVVQMALAKLKGGHHLTEAEHDLALILPEDLEDVDDVIPSLAVDGQPSEDRARLWLFLVLDWLWHHREMFSDPLEIVELLYADFEYPEEIQGLIRFMPLPPNDPSQPVDRWREYLDGERHRYNERGRASAGNQG